MEKEISACPACNECPKNEFDHACKGYYKKCDKWLDWFYKSWSELREDAVSVKEMKERRIKSLIDEMRKNGKVK